MWRVITIRNKIMEKKRKKKIKADRSKDDCINERVASVSVSIVLVLGVEVVRLCGLQLYIHVTSVFIPMIILIPCVPIIIMIMYWHVIDVWGSMG